MVARRCRHLLHETLQAPRRLLRLGRYPDDVVGDPPITLLISPATRSGSAATRSILLIAGITSRSGVDRQVGVGQGLGLDPLGIHQQQRTSHAASDRDTS